MKFMKLGVHPDTFYTEEATRSVISDVPSDLSIRINNITYLLHKHILLPKCGLLHRLFSDKDDSGDTTVDLHDIPGGEEAFELCAKFCYGITISLSAQNFVPAFSAAKFLRMTEAAENGNFVTKLEAFFSSCILQGWKDTAVTLHNTESVYEWSENLGIVRRCIESIVDKILTPAAKVKWSYTYTRPGYQKKRHPKDWWTEDISLLGIDIFRSIITTINSTNMVQPRLIGEALHVYASCWLLDSSPNGGSSSKRRTLEAIVSLIPSDRGSVSIKFLLRLLSLTAPLGASPVTKAQLLRFCALQLEEAVPDDLMFRAQSSYDVDFVKTVVQSFLRMWKRQGSVGEGRSTRSIRKVGKLVDSYLQVVAKDAKVPVRKVASLIEAVPEVARPQHDDLYKAINSYLKEHPDVTKSDKKALCRYLDCQKLSPEVRSHAVKNERLPLRTVVQALFFDQDKISGIRDDISNKLKLNAEEQSGTTRPPGPAETSATHQQLRPEASFKTRPEMERSHTTKGGGER